jgi:hypothetical protein
MQRDSTLTLALNLQANPGVYALLIGSGVSTGAGMPTGWGIVQDLIRRLAAAKKETATPNVEEWYRATFGEEPDYDVVLAHVTKTQADRQALLRRYFEPTPQEREAGTKLPTAAHRAIAQLARLGYIRLILTTNFDQLLEQALEAVGVPTTVISTPDQMEGAAPLVHAAGCTIAKLHGDYKDARIRNTSDELAEYPPTIRTFLARVFDEFGLIVCGWSGDWDVALRDAILSAPGRRFGTYWFVRSETKTPPRVMGEAQGIVEHRQATVIAISGAEQIFPLVLEQVESLRELDRPDPVSVQVAIATTKRYLVEERHRIRLQDLVLDEAEDARRHLLADSVFDVGRPEPDTESVTTRLRVVDADTGRLCAMLAVVGYHGRPQHAPMLSRVITRIGPPVFHGGRYFPAWQSVQIYPMLSAIYSVGIAALVAHNFNFLAAVLLEPFIKLINQQKIPVLAGASGAILASNGVKQLLPPPLNTNQTPGNEYMENALRELLQPYLPGEDDYAEAFDQFEYFLSLLYWHRLERGAAPLGNFAWRRWGMTNTPDDPVLRAFVSELRERGAEWGLFEAGFFHDVNGLDQVVAAFNEWGFPASQRLAWGR